MNEKNNTVSNSEIREVAAAIAALNRLPLTERTAIKFYLKGRIDALTGNIEIPTGLVRDALAAAM